MDWQKNGVHPAAAANHRRGFRANGGVEGTSTTRSDAQTTASSGDASGLTGERARVRPTVQRAGGGVDAGIARKYADGAGAGRRRSGGTATVQRRVYDGLYPVGLEASGNEAGATIGASTRAVASLPDRLEAA